MKQIMLLACALIVLASLLLIPAVTAQTPIPQTPGALTPAPTTSADDVLAEVRRLEDRATSALTTLDRLLGVIQLIGAALAILAGIAAIVGYRNTEQQRSELREELSDARATINNTTAALADIQKFRDETRKNLFEMDTLRSQITTSLYEMRIQIRQDLDSTSRRSNAATQALAMAQLAQQQIAIGNLVSAAATLETACKIDPENRVIQYFLGDVCVRLGRAEDGIVHLKEAMNGNDFPSASVSYAYALRVQGDNEQDSTLREMRYAEAMAIFLREFKRHPELLDISGESAYGALAGLYRRQGRLDKAIEIYKHAHQMTPHNSYPVNNLALLSYLHGNREEAIEYFKKSLEIARRKLLTEPSEYWTWFDLVTAEIALEADREQVARELEAAIELAPGIEPLEKLLLGIQELVSVPNGPSYDEQVMLRLREEIERRRAMVGAAHG
jgi:tetratricopeptide (TPR) repeat protein